MNEDNKKTYGDRGTRSRGGQRGNYSSDRPRRPYNPDAPRREYSSDRPRRPYNPDAPKREYSSDRPRRPYNPDAPKREYSSDRPRRPYNPDAPKREYSSDRPRRPYNPDAPKRYGSNYSKYSEFNGVDESKHQKYIDGVKSERMIKTNNYLADEDNSQPIEEETVKKDPFVQVGNRFVVEFTSMTHDGLGVCKINGKTREGVEYVNYPLFVSDAIVGESGIVEITVLHKTLGYGKLLKLFFDKRSVDRNKPICSHYGECGGCNLMHLKYAAQLSFKQNMVKETLVRIGGIEKPIVHPVLGMNVPLYYRNKVQIPCASSFRKTLIGFYKRESHEIIPLDECFIQPKVVTEVVKFVKNLCGEFKISGYNERYKEGTLRHVMARINRTNDKVMLVLVVTQYPFLVKNDEQLFLDKIIKRFPVVESVVANLNEASSNVVLGEKNIVLRGNNYLMDTLCGKTFRIGVNSFYQVNTSQTEVLYQTALKMALLSKEDVLVDAYCGIGTIGIIASFLVKKVYGVEIVPEAIENALENIKLNNCTNCEYVCNSAENQIVEWSKTKISPTVVVVDPPRKGCDELFLKTIVDMKVSKVLYISCDPATLARDCKYLMANNYSVGDFQPVDLFPETNHIETITTLWLQK